MYSHPLQVESHHFPLIQAEVVVPDVIRTLNLTGWLESCQEFRLEMDVKISGYLLEAQQETESGRRCSYPLDGADVPASDTISAGPLDVSGGCQLCVVFRDMLRWLP